MYFSITGNRNGTVLGKIDGNQRTFDDAFLDFLHIEELLFPINLFDNEVSPARFVV